MSSSISFFEPQRVAVTDLPTRLAELEESIEEHGFLKTGRTSTVVFQGDLSDAEVDESIDKLAILQPSRFFLLRFLPIGSKPSVDIGGRCHVLASGSTVCSEIVDISFCPDDVHRIASLVAACFVPGTLRQVVALRLTTHSRVLRQFVRIVDEIFYDSDHVTGALKLLEILPSAERTPVDLQWIRWSFLRDEVRQAFESADMTARLAALSEIRMTFRIAGRQELPPSLYLFAGWVMSRLQLEPLALSARGYECQSPSGATTIVRLKCEECAEGLGDFEISFCTPEATFVSLVGHLEGDRWTLQCLSHGSPVSAPRKIQAVDDSFSLLKRHFHIGESFVNYPPSAQVSLQMESLKSAFYSRMS